MNVSPSKIQVLFVAPVFLFVMLCFRVQASKVQAEFSDILDSPYKASIEILSKRGIVSGYADGTFRPRQNITRGEILKFILAATAKENIKNLGNCFSEIPDDWDVENDCYGKEQGIISGYLNGTFKLAQNVTMVEGLKMSLDGFSVMIPDREGVWYKKYVDFSHDNNLFSRYSIRPQGFMTRGQTAFLIHQLILDKEGTQKLPGKRDSRSEGCGKEPPSDVPTSFTVNGRIRHAITVIPSQYDKNIPIKLVFAFHGRTNPNTKVRTYYKVEQAARGEAIFIYPAGLPEEGPNRSWRDPGDSPGELRDFQFFDRLLDDLSKNYCIDLDKVYVVGHSLGAWFANSLSCARGDKIRAIGSVAGGTTINECSGPVAALIMHNPKDTLVSISAGENNRDQMIRQNRCGTKTIPAEPREYNCVTYQECNEIAPLIWCPHTDSTGHGGAYYPHTWPDHAGAAIWNFFNSLKD